MSGIQKTISDAWTSMSKAIDQQLNTVREAFQTDGEKQVESIAKIGLRVIQALAAIFVVASVCSFAAAPSLGSLVKVGVVTVLSGDLFIISENCHRYLDKARIRAWVDFKEFIADKQMIKHAIKYTVIVKPLFNQFSKLDN